MAELIGRTFMKRFVGYGLWECTLTAFDECKQTWAGEYSDGTVETYSRAQIEKFLGPLELAGATALAKDTNAATKAAKTAAFVERMRALREARLAPAKDAAFVKRMQVARKNKKSLKRI